MSQAALEHVNITVSDPAGVAATLCDLFGWRIRWRGPALNGGETVHVGSDTDYLAVYKGKEGKTADIANYATPGALNHVGVLVDDLDAAEARVKAAGFTPRSHADYEPGRRFYFDGPDDIEFEVVSYAGG